MNFLNWDFYWKVYEFVYNSVFIDMKNQNSEKDLDLQVNKYIKANFMCYFNASSTIHKIGPLCCDQIKTHCPKSG